MLASAPCGTLVALTFYRLLQKNPALRSCAGAPPTHHIHLPRDGGAARLCRLAQGNLFSNLPRCLLQRVQHTLGMLVPAARQRACAPLPTGEPGGKMVGSWWWGIAGKRSTASFNVVNGTPHHRAQRQPSCSTPTTTSCWAGCPSTLLTRGQCTHAGTQAHTHTHARTRTHGRTRTEGAGPRRKAAGAPLPRPFPPAARRSDQVRFCSIRTQPG